MKSKITLILLLTIIVASLATNVFLANKYKNEKQNSQNLNSEIEEIKENYESKQESKVQVVEKEVEKYAIPKFDSSKIDTGGVNYQSIEEVGRSVNNGSYIVRFGPRKRIDLYSSDKLDDCNQIEFDGKGYNFSDKNIVADATQNHGSAADWYIILLLEDGTIYYSEHTIYPSEDGHTSLDSITDFKKYDELSDVVGLVNLVISGNGGHVNQRVGAITSDGVTHILPFDLP